MNESGKTAKYVIVALAAVVVALLLVVAFLLGRGSGNKNQNQNPTVPSGTQSGQTADPGTTAAPSGNNDADPSASDAASQPAETDAPRNLEISMSAGSLTFVEGSAFQIDYDKTVISVSTHGDSVTIENHHSHPSASQRRRMDVTVTVPAGFAFDSVDIEMGAGKMIVHSLNAEALDLELGAGSATFDSIYITGSAEIEEGAGELAIKGGKINNLTLQCGAGATRVAAALTGTNTVNAAVGAVDLKFDGSEADYTVAFQMGLGACYYNNQKIARNGSFGEGPTLVNISGGFGVMRVNVG